MPLNNKLTFFEKIKNIESISIPNFSHKCNSAPSVSIVYSKSGKRITISKSLAERLKLNKTCYMYLDFKDKIIFLTRDALAESAIQLSLNGDDKKICYKSSFVEYIVKEFNLDYSKATSHAFSKIAFEKEGDVEMAAIDVSEFVVSCSDTINVLEGDSNGEKN